MKKSTWLRIVVLVMVVGVGKGMAFSKDIDIGAETMTLKTTAEKKPAEFPHRLHQNIMSCMKCHHIDGRTITVRRCVSCHNEGMNNEKLNDFRKAAHLLCRGCHKLAREEGTPAPTRCSGCHPLKIKR